MPGILGAHWTRGAVAVGAVFFALGIDCVKRGPFGEEEVDVEDHTFMIELKNNTRVPVAFQEVDTGSGFVVEATDSGFIQRTAEPEQVFHWRASLGPAVSETIECRYHPPSDRTPTRRVEWDGNDLRCHFWDPS